MASPSKPNIYVQPLVEYDRITFWWLPSDSNDVINYVLECNSPPLTFTYGPFGPSGPTTTEAFIQNLSPFTQYSFTLKATNNSGDSELAYFDTVTTGFRPDPPTSLTASEEFYTSSSLISWSPPLYDGGSPVFDYVVTANAYTTSNVPVPEKNFFLSCDTPATTFLFPLETYDYEVKVQAINSCGYSAFTSPKWVYNLLHPGSLVFNGTSNYCAVTEPFTLSTTDFTVEFYFKLSSLTNTPYFFSCADSSGEAFSLKMQNNQFVLKYPSASSSEVEVFGSDADISGGWHHLAIIGETVLANRLLKIYLDGQIYHNTTSPSYSFTQTLLDFTIGQRSTPSNTCNFQGLLTNIRFVSGLAVYIANFTIPNPPLGIISGTGIQTELLMNVTDSGTSLVDSSGLNRTITNFGTTFSVEHP
jgi:hypothetical protein